MKAQLTRKQAEILETELKSSSVNGDKAKFVKMYVNLDEDDWQEGYPLTCLTDDMIIQALYVGYEIKQENIVVTITPETQERLKKYHVVGDKTRNRHFTEDLEDILDVLGVTIPGINDYGEVNEQ